jgi:hypothetical protein
VWSAIIGAITARIPTVPYAPATASSPVNQAGHEQSVGSLDRLDIVARDAPHRLDRSDETVLDEHVRWIARHKIRAQHTPAANQGAHAVSLPCAMCRPIS